MARYDLRAADLQLDALGFSLENAICHLRSKVLYASAVYLLFFWSISISFTNLVTAQSRNESSTAIVLPLKFSDPHLWSNFSCWFSLPSRNYHRCKISLDRVSLFFILLVNFFLRIGDLLLVRRFDEE